MNDFDEYIRQDEPQKRERGYAWKTANRTSTEQVRMFLYDCLNN